MNLSWDILDLCEEKYMVERRLRRFDASWPLTVSLDLLLMLMLLRKEKCRSIRRRFYLMETHISPQHEVSGGSRIFQRGTNPNGGGTHLLLPAATKLGQSNVFTGVCDSVHGGGLPQCMLGYHPPRTRHTKPHPPGADHHHPPGPDTPPPPPRSRPPPPGADPPDQTPPGKQTPA